ncbi:MAG: hypothetical protein WBX15_09405 [Thermoanaerobaculia bacterium]
MEDIVRWEDSYTRAVASAIRKISAGRIDRGYEFTSLSRRHEYLGLTQVALGNYAKALGHFGAAAGAWAYLLERYVAGEEIDRELIDRIASQPFLLALAANDERTLAKLANIYERAFPEARTGRNDLHWMGLVTAELASGNVDLVSEWVGSPPPTVNPETARYYSCLLNHDEEKFKESILGRSERWKKRIRSEGLGRFPDAVCDHTQIGSIRLFERLWSRRPDVDLAAARIPAEIFDAVAEPVEGML